MTPAAAPPSILLVMEDGDEAQTVHVLTKYHFANSLHKIRRLDEAKRAIGRFNAAGEGSLPELLIVSLTGAGLSEILGMARQGPMSKVPLVVVLGSREEEESVRARNLPNTYVMAKPLGFFKLLEALQKLGMFWMVLRNPGTA